MKAIGYTQAGWLHVEILWVRGDRRGQGWGRALITGRDADR